MILFPAIDIKGGNCVRLLRGEMDGAVIFNTDPVDQAIKFVTQGCQWLHVVDIDGAIAGKAVNRHAVMAIVSAVNVPIQFGGGIRSMHEIENWIDTGVERIILGTAAVRDLDLVRAACKAYPGRIYVGIDARDGLVAVQGWSETSEVRALDLALQLEDIGVAAIIFTDIERDGMLKGINLGATVELAEALRVPVIASGGVASLADLFALKDKEDSGIAGVIVGRALYNEQIDIADAVRLLGA